MSFIPAPPTITSDSLFSSLKISNLVDSQSLYTNGTITGVPLSITDKGLIGITPTVSKVFPVGVTPAAIAINNSGDLAYVCNNNNYVIPGSDSVTVLDLVNGVPLKTINDASFNQPYTVTIASDDTIGSGPFGPLAGLVYVTNSAGTTVTVISGTTVSGTIGSFDGPSGFAIKGSKAYVNNYGAAGGAGSGFGTTVSVVDLTTATVTSSITVGLAPAAMALTNDNRFLYVLLYTTGATDAGIVSIINTTTDTVVGTIGSFSGPFSIAMSPNGLAAYVTNFGSNNFVPYGTSVSVIDLQTNVVTDTIQVGIQPSGIAISPDGLKAFVTNYNTLYTQSFNAPVNAPGTGTVTMSSLVPGQGTVSIIDTYSGTVTGTIAVGQSPSAIAIDPNGSWAYVTNYTSGTVSGIYINQGP